MRSPLEALSQMRAALLRSRRAFEHQTWAWKTASDLIGL